MLRFKLVEERINGRGIAEVAHLRVVADYLCAVFFKCVAYRLADPARGTGDEGDLSR